MSRNMLERRLADVSARLAELRRDLEVAEDQARHLGDEADDARLRALVSETPLAEREHQDARRHAEAMQRHREAVLSSITSLEQVQDELLDRLSAELRR